MVEADLDRVTQIEAQAHAYPWRRGHFADSLAAGHLALVASLDSEREDIVAYAIAFTVVGEAELLNLAVAPAFQRKGVARGLLGYLLEQLDTQAQRVFLEVRASNSPAIALYQQFGFKQVGFRPNYYPAANGLEHALVLARRAKG